MHATEWSKNRWVFLVLAMAYILAANFILGLFHEDLVGFSKGIRMLITLLALIPFGGLLSRAYQCHVSGASSNKVD